MLDISTNTLVMHKKLVLVSITGTSFLCEHCVSLGVSNSLSGPTTGNNSSHIAFIIPNMIPARQSVLASTMLECKV